MASKGSDAAVAAVLMRALIAAKTDDRAELERCLDECPEVVNAQDSGNYTVAKAAAADGSLGCLKLAIERGADVSPMRPRLQTHTDWHRALAPASPWPGRLLLLTPGRERR